MCPIGYGTCRPLRSVCALKHIQFCSQRPTTQRIPFRQGHTHSKRKKGSYYHHFRHNMAVVNAPAIGVAAAAQAGPVQPKYPVIPPVDAKALIAGKARAVALDQIVGDVQVVKALPGDMNFVTDYCGNKRAFRLGSRASSGMGTCGRSSGIRKASSTRGGSSRGRPATCRRMTCWRC